MESRAEPPLAGRRVELEFLVNQLAGAMAGNGKTVFMSGSAGVGKTRLCEEFEAIATRAGCMTLVGRCLPGAPRPYLPFEEALERCSSKAGRFGLKQGTGDTRRSFMENQVQSDLYVSGLLETLKTRSARQPIVFRLEDFHWGDSASINAINFFSRNCATLKILFIVTYRPEDLERSAEGQPHKIQDIERLLKWDGLAVNISLNPLKGADLCEAMETWLGGRIEDSLSELIQSESGGIPLYAVELVRLMLDTQEIIFDRGTWRRQNNERVPVSATVQEIILRRTDRLSATNRRVLECGSVIGGTFDSDIISEVLALPALAALESLENLVHIDHLLMKAGKRYRFSHEKIQRVAYNSISPARLKELHRGVASYFESKGDVEIVPGELANHFCKGGELSKCLNFSYLAGEQYWNSCSFPESIPQLTRVVELAKRGPGRQAMICRAREWLGDAKFNLQNYEGALQHFLDGLVEANGPQRPRLLRKIAECWLMGNLGWDMLLANCIISEAESCNDIEPEELGQIYHFKARAAFWTGRYDEAEKYHLLAEQIYEKESLHAQLAWELSNHGNLNASQERYDEALTRCLTALQIYSEHPFKSGIMETHQVLGEVYFVKGLYEDAINHLLLSNIMASQTGDHYCLRHNHYHLSQIYSELDDRKRAMEHIQKSIDEGKKEQAKYLLLSPTFFAHLLVLEGKIDEAEGIVSEVQRIIDENFKEIITPLKGLAKVTMGEVKASRGDYTQSDALFQEGLQLLDHVTAGSNYRAIAHIWYGNVLKKQGRMDKSDIEYNKAKNMFERNGNLPGRDKAAALISR